MSVYAYDLGMGALDRFIDDRLHGRNTFSRQEVDAAAGLSSGALTAALTRLSKSKRLASPRNGFFLILRPEDRSIGGPDPGQWIDPLMRYLKLDYRISLLRAAAFHGSSHQAVMVFQVVVPHQLRQIELGRHRIEFIYQTPIAFSEANQQDSLDTLKTSTGYARVAGIELTLLDCARYFHRAGGINSVAQVAKDLGAKAVPRKLARLASIYESSCVRRLGYLLEHVGHERQANVLEPFARKAKTAVALDPSIDRRLVTSRVLEKSQRWKLLLNERVEVDF